ncbi:c-type cytochrome [Candidatus Albibeggiatoa sp. nov. NOAA]|uniref:c-type cytochrome n=1 Tax=Candidatus Albibeggiatoa sp. nov. NOAA TaxID=3162724 RepID=UPI003301BD46|nr:c-type cytochrome [Thiotrichaceae bacterium]
MSQSDSIRARNQFIWWMVIPSVLILGGIIYLLVEKLGADFGNSIAQNATPEFEQQAIELRLQPVGSVNVGEPMQVAAVEDKGTSNLSPEDQRITDLIKDSGYACLGCHKVDAALVGPSYREVGQKYQGDANAAAMLAEKIKAGGVGTWGQVPMPPNPTVSDAHMTEIVEWVLGLGAASAEAAPVEEVPAPAAEATTEEAAPAVSAEVLTTEQATALMSEKGYICMTCHQVEMKVVGPSYKDVAAKYADDAGAMALLKEKILQGGVGTWGQIPMPANPTVTDSDADALSAWILSLK